jgi:hypothetical protein
VLQWLPEQLPQEWDDLEIPVLSGDQLFHLGAAAFFALYRAGGRERAQEFFKNRAALPAFIIIDGHSSPQKFILPQGLGIVKKTNDRN